MYRADWTSLSAAVDVTEFEDYEVRHRMAESRRPSWAPPPGPAASRPADRGPGSRWAAASDEDDDAGDPEGREDPDETGESDSWPSRQTSYRLEIAPGGRFRYIRADDSAQESGPPPCAELLCPAWLPA